MWQIVEKINELLRTGAVHRKGFSIHDATPMMSCGHMIGEAAEALETINFNQGRERQKEELADVLNCLVHTAMLLEIPLEEVISQAVSKLELRYHVPTKKASDFLDAVKK